MYLGSFTKQPAERLPVDISYSSVIAGRTTTSITSVITSAPSGMTKGFDAITGEVLQVFVEGGTDGITYRWTVVTTIVIGGQNTIVEDEFDVLVEAV